MFKIVARFILRRPTKILTSPPRFNWSRAAKRRSSAVYDAVSSNVTSLHRYSVLSKMQWTRRPTPAQTCQPQYVTLVGGHWVPLHPVETRLSKVQRRAFRKALFVIPEDPQGSETDDDDDASDDA
ncbi:hypothetical protein SDRG_04209 [Saprolegnia diclina VS20]|uniref:Uncharacterized protein n=1 Tax=Saprolegnia diclina (strain VS20) TaxID=1156394 RepID=T0S778_SAPDV|nr:hypothetical protein SDRG_04209 [Saprolegnia diclina VS20]EQC38502.1 hypothetical protein SDRG_04209 [Saprolegnia diclina VS20]|eukprot:XP_008608094.1 hypothetical protein SDRG_04209 [Saprolegnia diclina VS20]